MPAVVPSNSAKSAIGRTSRQIRFLSDIPEVHPKAEKPYRKCSPEPVLSLALPGLQSIPHSVQTLKQLKDEAISIKFHCELIFC